MNQSIRRVFGGAWESLAGLGGALVRPIEGLFAATFGRLLRVVEGFERIDKWLLGLLWLLTWPVRVVWRLIIGLGALVLPKSVLSAFGDVIPALNRFQHWFAESAWGLVEWLNLDGLMRWIAWLTQPVWRPIAAIGGFLLAWVATRSYRSLVWGAPVLVLLLPILAAVGWSATFGHGGVAGQYRAAAKEAREKDDFDLARFLERKLELLGEDTKTANFKAAVALGEEGKLDEAYAIMQTLAPEAKPDYPPAHHWILVRLLGGDLKVPADDRLRLAGVHLGHLKRLGFKGQDYNLLRAIWLAQSGKLEEAATLLEPMISGNQLAALQRFEIDLRLNRLEEAKRDARALTALFEAARRRKEKFVSDQYRAWAQAEQLLGNMTEWARVVREWLALDPKNELARISVVQLDSAEFADILRSPLPDPKELAERLLEVARLSDKPTALEPQVANLYHMRHQVPAISEMIDQLVALPDAPLTLTSALGTAAALDGDIVVARTMLSRVVAQDDKNAVAWNNLAWALSQDPGKDLDKAFAAVSRALELTPEEFRFRETRGQILVSLGRYQEAIDDLEFALNGMPDATPIHIALATAYEKLGQTELAEVHRTQAH